MKKTCFAAVLLALLSCSEDNLLTDASAEKKDPSSAKELNLLEFDESCIHLSTVDNDPYGDNRECIQQQIDLAKSNGYDGLHIGALDCYVNVTFAADKSLKIPSDFALVMDANTIFRVTPNSAAGYSFMDVGGNYSVPDIENVLISGGQFYGDRLLHNNTSIHGHLLRIISAHDVTVNGVSLIEANCDGLYVSGKVISNQPNYTQPYNLNIQNCNFFRNRRSNISITDGHDIDISYCKFEDAGINMPNSNGYSPKMSVNVEGDRTWNTAHTELVWFKHPHDIFIHHNGEKGSQGGAFYASLAESVTISDNTSKSSIGYIYGNNIIVKGNTVTDAATGISCGFNSATSIVNHDNEIYYNHIKNCTKGLLLYNRSTTVSHNDFTDCGAYAITFANLTDCAIADNLIESSVSGSSGIKVTSGGQADNVYISNNTIDIDGGNTSTGLWIQNVNASSGQENFKLFIQNNDITTTGSTKLAAITGAEVSLNTIRTHYSLTLSYMNDMNVHDNSIINISPTANAHALLIKDNNATASVTNNFIENQSSNANAHCVQLMDTSDLDFSYNTLKQAMTKTLTTINLSDSSVTHNTGVIGSASYFVWANATNCVFTDNYCDTPPFTRQNINGVITVL